VVTMEFVDDCTFGWSDLVAMWLIVSTLATLLAIQVMGGVMRLRVQCHGAVLFSECQSGTGGIVPPGHAVSPPERSCSLVQ
jgi:hypothetical protein